MKRSEIGGGHRRRNQAMLARVGAARWRKTRVIAHRAHCGVRAARMRFRFLWRAVAPCCAHCAPAVVVQLSWRALKHHQQRLRALASWRACANSRAHRLRCAARRGALISNGIVGMRNSNRARWRRWAARRHGCAGRLRWRKQRLRGKYSTCASRIMYALARTGITCCWPRGCTRTALATSPRRMACFTQHSAQRIKYAARCRPRTAYRACAQAARLADARAAAHRVRAAYVAYTSSWRAARQHGARSVGTRASNMRLALRRGITRAHKLPLAFLLRWRHAFTAFVTHSTRASRAKTCEIISKQRKASVAVWTSAWRVWHGCCARSAARPLFRRAAAAALRIFASNAGAAAAAAGGRNQSENQRKSIRRKQSAKISENHRRKHENAWR